MVTVRWVVANKTRFSGCIRMYKIYIRTNNCSNSLLILVHNINFSYLSILIDCKPIFESKVFVYFTLDAVHKVKAVFIMTLIRTTQSGHFDLNQSTHRTKINLTQSYKLRKPWKLIENCLYTQPKRGFLPW